MSHGFGYLHEKGGCPSLQVQIICLMSLKKSLHLGVVMYLYQCELAAAFKFNDDLPDSH